MRILMGNIGAIFRKELQGYFVSPLAYVTAGIFWLLAGFFFVSILLGPEGMIQQADMLDAQKAQMEEMGIPVPPLDLPYEFLQAFLRVMSSLSLFILPILSMGLYTEERKLGTLELLATSPITNWAVAVGKLLGVLTFFITMIAPLLGCEAIVLSATTPPMPPAVPLLGHAALILLAASILSLGMFISSLTNSTILSAIFTFAVVLFLSVIELLANNVGGPIGQALSHLSLLKHYSTLVSGIVDTSSLILFGSYILLGIFLTAQYIEVLRFQRS